MQVSDQVWVVSVVDKDQKIYTTCKITSPLVKIQVTNTDTWELAITASSERVSHHDICTGKPQADLLKNIWRGHGADLLQSKGNSTGKVDVRGGGGGEVRSEEGVWRAGSSFKHFIMTKYEIKLLILLN